jgi:hypothetical protein
MKPLTKKDFLNSLMKREFINPFSGRKWYDYVIHFTNHPHKGYNFAVKNKLEAWTAYKLFEEKI